MKRIKSYLIDIVSIFGVAAIATIASPAWSNFVVFANDKLLSMGVPAVVIVLIGKFVSEVWKDILNQRSLQIASGKRSIDLY